MPTFTPIPLRYRKDGWTPLKQADFLGALAETGSVSAAARRVGLTREGAYRLREKAGAQSFAAAWDAILAGRPATAPKVTPSLPMHRALYGSLKPIMRAGRHVATVASPDNDALLRLYRKTQRHRSAGRGDGKSQPK